MIQIFNQLAHEVCNNYNSTVIFTVNALPLVRFDRVISLAGQISANTPGQISPWKLSTYIEFGLFVCLFASKYGRYRLSFTVRSASIELKKELLSKKTPQNAKSCTKFAFNVFDSKSHNNLTRVVLKLPVLPVVTVIFQGAAHDTLT